MNPDLARVAAHELAAELTQSLQTIKFESESCIRNLSEVFYLGGVVAIAMTTYWKPSSDQTVIDEVKRICKVFELGKMDRDTWEQLLCEKFTLDQMTPDEARQGVQFLRRLFASRGLQRQIVTRALNESFPKSEPGEPGRTPKIRNEEYEALAASSREIVAFVRHFEEFRATFPSRSLEELIEFLASDYLQEASLLAQHVSTVHKVLAATEFVALKTIAGRAQFLADAIAGDQYDLEPPYAHQVAEEGRRRMQRATEAENQ
jgi:predicted house-cleaning noncanonical NTP pyrophosphatase (MazG superfamily)